MPAPDSHSFAAYLRVSTALQGDSRLGLEAQERAVREYAKVHGLTIGEVVIEVVSGAKSRLPLRAKLLERCAAGEFAGILTAKLDRIGRSAIDLLTIFQAIERHGYKIVFVEQGIQAPGRNATEKAFIGNLAVWAEFERNLISERTREGLASARARGVVLGPVARLSEDAARRVVELRAMKLGTSEIARRLNAEGVASSSGKPWRHSMVADVLRRMA